MKGIEGGSRENVRVRISANGDLEEKEHVGYAGDGQLDRAPMFEDPALDGRLHFTGDPILRLVQKNNVHYQFLQPLLSFFEAKKRGEPTVSRLHRGYINARAPIRPWGLCAGAPSADAEAHAHDLS